MYVCMYVHIRHYIKNSIHTYVGTQMHLSGQSEHTIGEVSRNCQCSGVVRCNKELPLKASGIRRKYAPAVMGSSSLPWR